VIAAVALAVFLPMLVEALRARRNEAVQHARGGVEPPDDIYKAIRVAYPAAFLAMLAEGGWRGPVATTVAIAGAVVFVFAKTLKWWAVVTLGPAWTFRVIVVPQAPLVAGGPYRFLRHPNYVGVLGELTGVALMTGARIAGPIATLTFAALLVRRVSVEERALRAATTRR